MFYKSNFIKSNMKFLGITLTYSNPTYDKGRLFYQALFYNFTILLFVNLRYFYSLKDS